MEQQLKQPPEMDFSSEGNRAERWKRWRQTIELYINVAMVGKSDKAKCHTVLYIIGQEGREIYNTFQFQEANVNKLKPLMEQFEKYCIPRKNVTVERYKFNTRFQCQQESIDQFVTDLRNMASNCEFGEIRDELIRDRIVCGTSSKRVQERLLREDKLTLEKAIILCRAEGESKRQIQKINEEQGASVHVVKRKKENKKHKEPKGADGGYNSTQNTGQKLNCNKCGTLHVKRNCPAYGKTCHKCKRQNHFATCCISTSRTVHNLDEISDSESDEIFIGSVEAQSEHKTEVRDNECYSTVNLNDNSINFKIDTGSQANIISKNIYKKVRKNRHGLVKSKTKLVSYTGDKLKILGKTNLICNGRELEFYVTESEQPALLGFRASQDLGLIKVVLRYCYLRTPFGIKSAQEVFQKRISQQFEDFVGVETDIDDILIWGTTQKQHDERLKKALQRCEDIGLTLNKEKCKIGVSEVTYIGHLLTADGVKPDVDKIKAITDMPAPTDKPGVMRLLGTVNYLAKSVSNLSEITEPIRSLLKQDVEFIWNAEQAQSFEKIKQILTQEPVLKYYDVSKPVTVSCDASKSSLGAVLLQDEKPIAYVSSLGAVLLQDEKPIAYVSRSMTDAETRYAQIEKELLAVLFGMERFHQYTYGMKVKVESDHKPLESILKKPLSNAPPRLQRMLLRLQKDDFELIYKPGKKNAGTRYAIQSLSTK